MMMRPTAVSPEDYKPMEEPVPIDLGESLVPTPPLPCLHTPSASNDSLLDFRQQSLAAAIAFFVAPQQSQEGGNLPFHAHGDNQSGKDWSGEKSWKGKA